MSPGMLLSAALVCFVCICEGLLDDEGIAAAAGGGGGGLAPGEGKLRGRTLLTSRRTRGGVHPRTHERHERQFGAKSANTRFGARGQHPVHLQKQWQAAKKTGMHKKLGWAPDEKRIEGKKAGWAYHKHLKEGRDDPENPRSAGWHRHIQKLEGKHGHPVKNKQAMAKQKLHPHGTEAHRKGIDANARRLAHQKERAELLAKRVEQREKRRGERAATRRGGRGGTKSSKSKGGSLSSVLGK